MSKKLKAMYRQGDVLLMRVDSIPESAKKVKNKKRIVLAHGEVTGHAHEIETKFAEELVAEAERYINVEKDSLLTHQEHGTIAIERGKYKIVRQREYSPEEIRNVAD